MDSKHQFFCLISGTMKEKVMVCRLKFMFTSINLGIYASLGKRGEYR